MNATETYQARRQEIDAKIARLQDLLKDMDENQAADPKNWGFAGSAGHVSSELDAILDFIGNQQN